ncbi:hypothetical protein AB4Z48_14490 [Cupriavidus sp. 2TAF22]|uniref:hypothetical protein n=1 Tax=unclassified Cupriavidus TaxID=2640874 RepID=UPI003F918FAF
MEALRSRRLLDRVSPAVLADLRRMQAATEWALAQAAADRVPVDPAGKGFEFARYDPGLRGFVVLRLRGRVSGA